MSKTSASCQNKDSLNQLIGLIQVDAHQAAVGSGKQPLFGGYIYGLMTPYWPSAILSVVAIVG